MRTATKLALDAIRREVDSFTAADSDSARKLLEAAATLDASKQLTDALVDRSASVDAKQALVDRVLAQRVGPGAAKVLNTAVAQKWDGTDELVAAVRDAGVRAIAQSANAHERIGAELDSFMQSISSNGELELALSSRLASGERKVQLLERLYARSLSAETMDILRSLLTLPNGKRIRRLITEARASVADQAGRKVATVTVARPLPDAQLERLRTSLSTRFGRDVTVNQKLDESVIGGMRVEFGDEVIDGTVAARLKNLRLQLA